MIDRFEGDLRLMRNALNLRSYRQELLASNIANADTPHFKAKDIDFKSALATVLEGQGENSLSLKLTSARHIEGQISSPLDGLAKYRTEYQSAVDGNTVNMDVERADFAENAIQVEALLTFVRGRFQTMQSAMQSQ